MISLRTKNQKRHFEMWQKQSDETHEQKKTVPVVVGSSWIGFHEISATIYIISSQIWARTKFTTFSASILRIFTCIVSGSFIGVIYLIPFDFEALHGNFRITNWKIIE